MVKVDWATSEWRYVPLSKEQRIFQSDLEKKIKFHFWSPRKISRVFEILMYPKDFPLDSILSWLCSFDHCFIYFNLIKRYAQNFVCLCVINYSFSFDQSLLISINFSMIHVVSIHSPTRAVQESIVMIFVSCRSMHIFFYYYIILFTYWNFCAHFSIHRKTSWYYSLNDKLSINVKNVCCHNCVL